MELSPIPAYLFNKLHRVVTRLEPWGILLALIAFSVDYQDRIEERKERQIERTMRAWQIVASKNIPGHAKSESIVYLGGKGLLVNANLPDLELSGSGLRNTDLGGADLRGSKLSKADLFSANLKDVELNGATLRSTDLSVVADLSGADLSRADLSLIHI